MIQIGCVSFQLTFEPLIANRELVVLGVVPIGAIDRHLPIARGLSPLHSRGIAGEHSGFPRPAELQRCYAGRGFTSVVVHNRDLLDAATVPIEAFYALVGQWIASFDIVNRFFAYPAQHSLDAVKHHKLDVFAAVERRLAATFQRHWTSSYARWCGPE